MRIELFHHHLPGVEGDLETLITRHFRRFERHIIAVEVRLADVNGPRGGRDKECQFLISTRASGDIVVTRTCESVRESVRACVHAAKRRLASGIGRLRQRQGSSRASAG